MASTPYVLSPIRRLRIIIEIAHNLNISKRIVANSSRTDAQLVALARDTQEGNFCVYHRRGLRANREIHDVHHIFRRHADTDSPAYCISLCFECHCNVTDHLGHPTDDELISLALQIARETSTPYSDSPPTPQPK